MRRLVAALFFGVVVVGCSTDPAGLHDNHIQRGDRYQTQGKLPEAVLEYRSAVQADPRSGVARQKLGNALFESRDYVAAFAELVRAADLMPDDLPAQLKASQSLLLIGHFDDARARADKVLERDPKNIDALIVKGNALAGMKDLDSAITEINRAIETDPTRSVGYAHLGAIQQAQGDRVKAEEAFKQAIAADPKSAQARLSLANLYWSTGRQADAEEVLKIAAQLEPSNPLPHRGLAMLYLGTGRLAEAEAPLKVVAEKSPTFEGKIALADYYANRRRIDEARAIYDELAASTGAAVPVAKLRLAALGLSQGNRDLAYKLIAEVLAKDPNHVEALVARAQLQFEDGKPNEALADARKATAAGGNMPVTHYVAGRILRSLGQLEDSEAAFKESVRVGPKFAPGNAELARLLIMTGRHAEAVTYAKAAFTNAPGFGDAYLLHARAAIGSGDPAAAEKSLSVMTTNFPNSPVVHSEVGLLRLAQGDYARAAASFEKALAQEPTMALAIEGMTNVDLKQGRRDAARRRLDQALAKAPANSELHVVAARFYAKDFSDLPAAQAAITRALDANPNNMAAYETLARVHATAGNLPGATAELEKVAARQPKSVATHTTIGILYQLQNNFEKARDAYQRALALDARAAVAANNLAQMYVDRNEHLDVALQLAQTAKAAMPKSHEVDDTLGWAYYKKGNGQSAVAALRAAVAARPDDPTYLYHLGAAYLMTKDPDRARTALTKAVNLQPTFSDARKMLDDMRQ